jgi:hypothetical protein
VTDITQAGALFVMKDGTQQRLSFIRDFRVLYVANRSARAEKLGFSKIRTLQVLPSTK